MLRAKKNKRVKVDQIKIPKDFLTTSPKPDKLIRKTADYVLYDDLSEIYIDEEYNLIDGYCSYLILKHLGCETIRCIMVRDSKRQGEN